MNNHLLLLLIFLSSLNTSIITFAAEPTSKSKKKLRIDIRDREKNLNNSRIEEQDSIKVQLLRDVIVTGSRNQRFNMETANIGALNLSRNTIAKTPTLFGESDIIKTLQLEPGVSAGIEGFAGLYVHGGNPDENMYCLDNVPLYQVNHFGGLFSAFNTESVRSADFYKSTFPARLDGKLSSYIDIYTRDGKANGYHGSFKLGLTSGALNIEGPLLCKQTTFSLSLRRSWFDTLTRPACFIFNHIKNADQYYTTFGYAFSDFNAKITHKFSDRSQLYFSGYWGDDYLLISQETRKESKQTYYEKAASSFNWGNLMASLGWKYEYNDNLTGRLTGAFSHYQSKLKIGSDDGERIDGKFKDMTIYRVGTDNFINDWRIKSDYDLIMGEYASLNFGTEAIIHDFLPMSSYSSLEYDGVRNEVSENVPRIRGAEINTYAEKVYSPTEKLKFSAGLHYSYFKLFSREDQHHNALSPRISFNYSPSEGWAVKGGYSRTSQFVYQLSQTLISLPTDQWIPIVGKQKPLLADKIAIGAYWNSNDLFSVSLEGYLKWMQNLMEFRDDYYLIPPSQAWQQRTVAGSGRAKGIDLKIAREFGTITGQVSYSLLFANRLFAEKNNGKRFPARFDNRHKFNVFLNWKPTKRVELSATWIGMSGNMITLPTQVWQAPDLDFDQPDAEVRTEVNNYRLPFFHKMDLSVVVNNSRGYWNFSIYNLYSSRNTITLLRGYSKESSKPKFFKLQLIPIIPSISYTWLF